ncbi:MAG: hypothetical protein R3B72_22005 [Polyangiaceae bacterium]
MALTDILLELEQAGWTGSVAVTASEGQATIHLRDGHPTALTLEGVAITDPSMVEVGLVRCMLWLEPATALDEGVEVIGEALCPVASVLVDAVERGFAMEEIATALGAVADRFVTLTDTPTAVAERCRLYAEDDQNFLALAARGLQLALLLQDAPVPTERAMVLLYALGLLGTVTLSDEPPVAEAPVRSRRHGAGDGWVEIAVDEPPPSRDPRSLQSDPRSLQSDPRSLQSDPRSLQSDPDGLRSDPSPASRGGHVARRDTPAPTSRADAPSDPVPVSHPPRIVEERMESRRPDPRRPARPGSEAPRRARPSGTRPLGDPPPPRPARVAGDPRRPPTPQPRMRRLATPPPEPVAPAGASGPPPLPPGGPSARRPPTPRPSSPGRARTSQPSAAPPRARTSQPGAPPRGRASQPGAPPPPRARAASLPDDGASVEELTRQGRQRLFNGDAVGAAGIFGRAHAMEPKNLELDLQHRWCRFASEAELGPELAPDVLKELASRALVGNRQFGFAYFVLGSIAALEDRADDALRAFRLAIRLDPDHTAAQRAEERLLASQGNDGPKSKSKRGLFQH